MLSLYYIVTESFNHKNYNLVWLYILVTINFIIMYKSLWLEAYYWQFVTKYYFLVAINFNYD